MKARILVAGVGNVFFGDDGFGVEVVRRLEGESLPDDVMVADFGVRALHLAFELLHPPEFFVLVDALSRGGRPGTLYVVDPSSSPGLLEAPPDAHAISPGTVLSMVQSMGAIVPRTLIVGCEPEGFDEPMSLSEAVRSAIDPAILVIRRLIETKGTNHEMDGEATR